jgi:hypothetical protein
MFKMRQLDDDVEGGDDDDDDDDDDDVNKEPSRTSGAI